MKYINVIQNNMFQAEFLIKDTFETNTSIYLEGEIREFLERKLETGYSVRSYINYLFVKYRNFVPNQLPKNLRTKKLIQERKENRKRFCFRPTQKEFWELKLLANALDMSIGYIIATMIWLEIHGVGEALSKIPEFVAISIASSKIIQEFKIKYNSKRGFIRKYFKFRRSKIRMRY